MKFIVCALILALCLSTSIQQTCDQHPMLDSFEALVNAVVALGANEGYATEWGTPIREAFEEADGDNAAFTNIAQASLSTCGLWTGPHDTCCVTASGATNTVQFIDRIIFQTYLQLKAKGTLFQLLADSFKKSEFYCRWGLSTFIPLEKEFKKQQAIAYRTVIQRLRGAACGLCAPPADWDTLFPEGEDTEEHSLAVITSEWTTYIETLEDAFTTANEQLTAITEYLADITANARTTNQGPRCESYKTAISNAFADLDQFNAAGVADFDDAYSFDVLEDFFPSDDASVPVLKLNSTASDSKQVSSYKSDVMKVPTLTTAYAAGRAWSSDWDESLQTSVSSRDNKIDEWEENNGEDDETDGEDGEDGEDTDGETSSRRILAVSQGTDGISVAVENTSQDSEINVDGVQFDGSIAAGFTNDYDADYLQESYVFEVSEVDDEEDDDDDEQNNNNNDSGASTIQLAVFVLLGLLALIF